MGRFRSSSLGSGAIILAFLLLLLHRYGTALLFLVIGAGLLWYGRMEREAKERAAREGQQVEETAPGESGPAPEPAAGDGGAGTADGEGAFGERPSDDERRG
ncbi:MAG: hypothetical protein P8Y05_13035 [Deinococcales bacterium]